MVHEYVDTFGLSVSEDYFYDLANAELEQGRYPEAAICIMNSKLFDRFDCLDLCLNLIGVNRMHEVK